MLKRSNENVQGEIKTSAARGQTLVTPVGKDNSDISFGKTGEVPNRMKMGGGMNNLSDSIPGRKD